jgi:sugar O-acyltransferase (sialic acid O-acetyltransferase NeuD family)
MYLYGASGHAKVIIDILKSHGKDIIGLIDDNVLINELLGYPVYHEVGTKLPLIISIGDNKTRKKIAEQLSGICFETAVHASAIVSDTCSIKEGTVVMQGSIIQSCSEIGRHCIINTGASVDHDCHVNDFVHISPHATLCGNVTVGEGTWIGAGTIIIPGVRIGKWCIIGAGSVVTKDIPDYVLAAGNRCKVIKQLSLT